MIQLPIERHHFGLGLPCLFSGATALMRTAKNARRHQIAVDNSTMYIARIINDDDDMWESLIMGAVAGTVLVKILYVP